MAHATAEEIKKDIDAQKKIVTAAKAASKDRRKDDKLRAERRTLRGLQRRWRQMTGKKIATIKKFAAGPVEDTKKAAKK